MIDIGSSLVVRLQAQAANFVYSSSTGLEDVVSRSALASFGADTVAKMAENLTAMNTVNDLARQAGASLASPIGLLEGLNRAAAGLGPSFGMDIPSFAVDESDLSTLIQNQIAQWTTLSTAANLSAALDLTPAAAFDQDDAWVAIRADAKLATYWSALITVTFLQLLTANDQSVPLSVRASLAAAMILLMMAIDNHETRL